MLLPPIKKMYRKPSFTFMGEEFRLREIEPTSSGWHVVFFDGSEGSFGYNDEIRYPVSREPQTWIGKKPRISDLVAGDMVNAHDLDERNAPWVLFGEDAWFDELPDDVRDRMSLEYTIESNRYQIVKMIWNGWMVTGESTGSNPKLRRYKIDDPHQIFDVGYSTSRWVDHTDRPEKRDVEFFGPYFWGPTGLDGDPTYFAVHPYGKGKWPGWVPEYERGAIGKARPPHAIEARSQEVKQPLVHEWSLWSTPELDANGQADGFTPHPADPRFKERKVEPGKIWSPYGRHARHQ